MSSARATKRSTARSKSPDMTKGETPGLRQIVQNRFLKDVFESAAGTFFVVASCRIVKEEVASCWACCCR
jgi:hypothetical protein